MISHDHITIDGDTAWWVVDPDKVVVGVVKMADRPCDVCHGDGFVEADAGLRKARCSDCHGTGRHVFTIDVEGDGVRQVGNLLSVYVVEVLPIVEGLGAVDGPMPRIAMVEGRGNYLMRPFVYPSPQITQPTAAEPSMWAVKLKVVA